MGKFLDDYLARIQVFLLSPIILGAICSIGNSFQITQAQLPRVTTTTTNVQTPFPRLPSLTNGAQYWQTRLGTYLTDTTKSMQYSYTTQPATSPLETQPPKQVRFTSQDAVDIEPYEPVNKYRYQLTRRQQQQQQKQQKPPLNHELPRHSQPETFSINTNQLNRFGKIQDLLPKKPSQPQVPISSRTSYASWTPIPIYAQQTLALPAGGLNPTGRIATVMMPVDEIQDRSGRVEEPQVYLKTTNNPSIKNEIQKTESGFFKRRLGRFYSGARNLVTGAFKQYATPGSLVLGASSLLAAAIPISMLISPGAITPTADLRGRRDGNNDPSDERPTNTSGVGLPASNQTANKFTIQGRVDSVMGWIERSVEHLPNFPRLHPQECVKRSICEAHNEPNKYGAIGFLLRLFFPATNLSITDRMDDMEYKVINKYRYAAGFGLNKRMDNNGTGSAVCREKYEDCLVSLLDVAQNLIDIFLK